MPTYQTFKVAAISKNIGAFGHKNHIMVAYDGTVIEGLRQPACHVPNNKDLREGEVITFVMGNDGLPMVGAGGFEIFSKFRDGKAPPMIVQELWG